MQRFRKCNNTKTQVPWYASEQYCDNMLFHNTNWELTIILKTVVSQRPNIYGNNENK
jgi:hypothetical protein